MKNCLTVANMTFEQALELIPQFPMAEIRMDLLEFTDEEYKKIFLLSTELIATCRNDTKISQLENAINYGADYIDIEYEILERDRNHLLGLAKSKKAKVIISHHNFDNSDSDKWDEIIKNSKEYGADFVKLAVKVDTKEDAIKLMNLYTKYQNIIAFGLGEWAQFTRIMSYYIGAPWVFVYYEKSIAEGQLRYDWKEKL